MEFEKLLGKDSPLLMSVRRRGFETPSEIQKMSIFPILEGKDVIAGASTGSGKTLAFAAGLIKNIKKDYGLQGLVLTPTRELAEQITNELTDFSKYKNLEVISVYGGVSITNQIKRLNYADIVVGTPGRILDHINRNSINLSKINTLVLDEADRMLDMGFREDVEAIIAHCPKNRQTMLFSATISADIVHLAQRHLVNPVEVSAEPHVDPNKLEQVYYDVEDNIKYSLLKHLIENEKSKLIMIFCNTRMNVDFVANNLKFMGINALPLHGGFSQDKRSRMLGNFHSEKVNVLVTTDVAARGLDIKGVSHVYNYNIPMTKNDYIHRIGRTARAGKEGKVINLVSGRDYENFQNLMTGEFNIVQIKTPFIQRARIRWMAERKSNRIRRRADMGRERNSRGFDNRSHDKRNYRDSSDRFGRKSYDRNPRRRVDNRSRNNRRESYGSRNQDNRINQKRFDARK